ncbi:hypothetical protein F4680DRAFT_467494 [Xylaria scruposa]|nr:hypothetical protein F4680DRAFT_467494 [Xylaria scruposa]
MVFQVSIGDAILLAQIAWRLAQTFTTGRQSAPAEFHEIENELYALGAALAAAENDHNNLQSLTNQAVRENSQSVIATQDTFEHIIQNFKQVLAHLEEIVDKYTIVSEKPDPQKPKSKRWSQSILKNWRKIEWTTEKGDLNTLRSQIMVYTNRKDLSDYSSSRTASIEQSLDKKSTLLEELHQWYVVNLKETTSKRSTTSDELIPAPDQPAQVLITTFGLAKKTEKGDEILCPCVALRREWIESFLDGTLGPSLGCMFALSHLIFPACIASNNGSWMLYKAADSSNNQLVDLYIRKIHPSYIRHLEDTFFRTLSSRRAGAILAQGVGDSLCYASQEDEEQHILEAMSDLNISQKSAESIIFRSGRTHHVREWIDNVQILQYGIWDSVGTQMHSTHWLEYAEVLISSNNDEAQESDDVVSMVLKLRRNTCTKLIEKASVDIMSIEAVGTHSDERTTAHSGLDVTFQFTTKSAAKEFHEKIENMRMELFVRSLQYPRSNERVVLSLQTARVECESLYIDDAEIINVVDADDRYRLITVSRNRCTIICQVLVEDFFTSPPNRPNYTGSTYQVQIDDAGERKIYYYKNGFRNLSLSTTQGLANILMSLTTNS